MLLDADSGHGRSRSPKTSLLPVLPERALWLLFCLLAASVLLPGQTTGSTGSVQGVVTDPNGAVVDGAKVSISNKATGRVITTLTSPAGVYASGALTPGEYTLRAEAKGFANAQIALTVYAGTTASGNIAMQVAAALPVLRNRVSVNTEQAAVQGVLATEQGDNLPINGRNFFDLAQLEPGVQIQDGGNFDPTQNGFSAVSFDGRYGRTTRAELDGLDISNEIAGGTTQNVPMGAVQELQVQQSMLDLSTELTTSGAVNVTTRPGANTYHGDGYYFFRDQSLDAALPGGSTNPFQRNQFGGDVGGAVLKNKLFFFLNAERTKQDLTNLVLPGGAFSALAATYSSPFRESNGVGRLDWQINNNYKFFYRFSYDQNNSVLAIVPNSFQPFGTENHTPAHAVGLDFSTGLYTHSIRAGYTKFRNAVTGSSAFNPAPGIELAIGSDPDCLTGGADSFCSGPSYLAPQQTYQSDLQFKYDGGRVLGAHILHYGGGFNRIVGDVFASYLALGPAVSASVSACTSACMLLGGASNPLNYPATTVQLSNGQGFASEIPAFGFPGGGTGPDNRIAAYFADSWKLKPNLTVTYGLRYVRDSGRSDSDLGPVAALSQFNNQYYSNLGARVNQPNLNFAPQLGFAYDPSDRGKTVFRGGIGLFYENSFWNNIAFDRRARLQTGLFPANPTVCNDGQPNPGFTLPGGAVPDLSFCGQPIGSVISQITSLQAQYQAATAAAGPAVNPSFIGNSVSDAIHANGTALLAPTYLTPRSVQMNLGFQRELHPGAVFTVDVLHNTEAHTLLALDTNHVGDYRFPNNNFVGAISSAMLATVAKNQGSASAGCPTLTPGPAMINCYLAHFNGNYVSGAADPNAGTIADFAANGLDSGYAFCTGGPCPNAAFPGINQNVGANQMLFPIGFAKNTAVQISLKQHLSNPFPGVTNFDLQASYQWQRSLASAADNDSINIASDFNNPQRYVGPTGLDRTNQFSFGGSMELPLHFRVSMIGHFASALPVTLTLNPTGAPGGIFVTDVTGDGSGDGSFASNGGRGDILPGTNVGSFGHSVDQNTLNTTIANYNRADAFQPTPAGQVLINSGLFGSTPTQSLANLQALKGVQQPVQPVPFDEAGMGWLRSFDANVSWVYKFRDRFIIQPGISAFNLANFANFNGPGNPLSGVLNGASGSVNGTVVPQPPGNRIGLGSGVFGEGSPRMLEFSLKLSF